MTDAKNTELHRDGGDEKNIEKGACHAVKPSSSARKKISAVEYVAAWRKENPNGHKSELYKTGKISRSSVNRYWDSCGEGDHPYSALERIFQWRQDNPYGTKKECIEATGLSRRSIFALWNKQPDGEQPIKQVIEKHPSVDSDENNVTPQPEDKIDQTDNEAVQKRTSEECIVEPKQEEQETVIVGKHGQLFFDF